jgi:IS30 family transposase
LIEQNHSIRKIASLLDRNPSTISRELKRGLTCTTQEQLRLPDISHTSLHYEPVTISRAFYDPLTAQELYHRRTQNSHKKYKMTGGILITVIIMLKNGLSPELISGRLYFETGYKLHNETIYQFIYSKEYEHMKLYQYLTKCHKIRRNKHKRQGGRSNIPFRVSIHEREEVVNTRQEFGHWEADSVLSPRKGIGGLHTEVERKTRYILVSKIKSTTSSENINVMLKMFSKVPLVARKSITFDNGSEFYKHYELTKQLSIKTYFADPYSAWQRGSNENANGRIRRFYPKGTDFSKIEDEELQEVVNFWNNRPMKCLGGRTPYEAWMDEVDAFDNKKATIQLA